MKFEVSKALINLRWVNILIVTTETEQDFYNAFFTEKKEMDEMIHVTTYIVRPVIWRHYPPAHDASNPDTHKYMFILQEVRTEVFDNQTAAEYAEALNILGVETEEEVTADA